MTSVSATRTMAAPPERVFALVTDLTRMGEWSPENVGGQWAKATPGPARDARFTGRNRNGTKSWTTTCRVTDFEPPSLFPFDVTAGPFKISRWEYRIEPTGSGCAVTETWTDRRNPLIVKLGGVFSGVSDRPAFNTSSIEATLERIDTASTA